MGLGKGKAEEKLDKFYDQFMREVERLFGRHDELRKLVREMNEEARNTRKEMHRMKETTKIIEENIKDIKDNLSGAGLQKTPQGFSVGASQQSSATAPAQKEQMTIVKGSKTSSQPMPASAPADASGQEVKPEEAGKAKKPKSLSEFLSDEVSIFEVSVLNAFVKATREVLKSNSRVEPKFLRPRVEKNIRLPVSLACKMPLEREGTGKGIMAILFEASSMQHIARNVLFIPEGENVRPADEEDVASEICNQICGKSKVLLKDKGFSFEIGRPVAVTGGPTEIMLRLTYPKLTMEFEYTESTRFYLCFWG